MPGRKISFVNGNFYHVYNRGSDKRELFLQPKDFQRFQKTFYYYQFQGPKLKLSKMLKLKMAPLQPLADKKLVEVICYCLMPNHFHFLVNQLKDNGISIFMSQLGNSYTRYFNTKYKRVGPLLQRVFKAVDINSDEQLIHVSRYIHLNPLVSGIVSKPDDYQWSSYKEYLSGNPTFSNPIEILKFFSPTQTYQDFVQDHVDYATSLEQLKHQLIDIEE